MVVTWQVTIGSAICMEHTTLAFRGDAFEFGNSGKRAMDRDFDVRWPEHHAQIAMAAFYSPIIAR